jgi:hypothetical protein
MLASTSVISEHITIPAERYNVISLRAEDPVAPLLIPPLNEPVLLGFVTPGVSAAWF